MLPCDTRTVTSSQVPGLQLTAHGMLAPESVHTIGSCERCDGNTSKCENLARRLQSLRLGVETIYRRPISETVECPPVTVEGPW
jgi:hypothetical protein